MTPQLRHVRIAAELIVTFALLAVADRMWAGGNGFAAFNPNPYWLPVLIFTLSYGGGIGVLSAVAASALWLSASHPPLGLGEDPFNWLLGLSLPSMLWVAAAMLLGEVTAMRLNRLGWLERRAAVFERNCATMIDAYRTLMRINRDLQVRIAVDDRGVSDAVATASALLTGGPADLAKTIARLIAIDAKSEDFTLYTMTGGGWNLCVSGATATERPLQPSHDLTVAIATADRPLHVGAAEDRAALAGEGVLALPLRHPGDTVLAGIVVFHTLPLERLTRHGLIEFQAMGEWIGQLLAGRPVLDHGAQPVRLRVVGSDLAP